VAKRDSPASVTGAKRIFVDTNVWVYAFSDTEHDKRDRARAAIEGRDVSISTQVLSELANVLLRKFLLPPAQVEQVLAQVVGAAQVIQLEATLISGALRLVERHQLAYYDAAIVAAALASGATELISEDFQAGKVFEGRLRVVSPFAKTASRKSQRK
jgi:predicted nucleic acid-binding protein